MREKFVYDVAWTPNDQPGYEVWVRFALDTPDPSIAIKQILDSDVAHKQKGSFSNFRGPAGRVWVNQ